MRQPVPQPQSNHMTGGLRHDPDRRSINLRPPKKPFATHLTQSVSETAITTMLAAEFFTWNVKGMAFGPLHDLFQKIYEDHFTAQE